MSILSQALEGKITFDTAVEQAGQWFDTILAKAPPAVQAGVADAESAFKQAASNAVMLADTDISPYLVTASTAVATAAETLLSTATGGFSTPLNPLITSGIQQLANALKAEIDSAAAAATAALAAKTTASTSGVTGSTGAAGLGA